MKIMSVWPGGMVELPGFEEREEGPLVVWAGPRKRKRRRAKVQRQQACSTAEAVRAVRLAKETGKS